MGSLILGGVFLLLVLAKTLGAPLPWWVVTMPLWGPFAGIFVYHIVVIWLLIVEAIFP